MDILRNRLSVLRNGRAFLRSKYIPRNNSGVPKSIWPIFRNTRIIPRSIFAPRKGPTVPRNAEPVLRTTNEDQVPGLYPLVSLCTDRCCWQYEIPDESWPTKNRLFRSICFHNYSMYTYLLRDYRFKRTYDEKLTE